MDYKLKSAKLDFNENGRLEKITTVAEMYGNPADVRTIEARASNPFWTGFFINWNADLQKILQKTTAYGSEVESV